MKLSDINLTLFFTGSVGLKTWAEVGNLDRELEIYKRLSNKLRRINFITYGRKRDRLYEKELGEINLLPTIWYRYPTLTILQLLLKYYPQINETDIIKTNQIFGSDIPLWLKNHFGKKLIVRCGYLHSRHTAKKCEDEKTIKNAVRLERDAFTSADMGIVTSAWQRDIVINKYDVDPSKIKVIPNYVITDTFKPHPEVQKEFTLIFVGRGQKQKNISNLLKAVHRLKTKNKNVSLLLVGDCCKDNKVREMANHYRVDATFEGNVPNFDLPYIINKAKIFILPSYYEGHPKALLEAMSCGLPCIGANVSGIREDIEHMKTGYLCRTDHESIADAIDALFSDESLQQRLGRNAREYVAMKYSIDKILKMELDVIQEVLAE